MRLRVLVACEFSGAVRRAFRKLGHDAWSCDLLPTEDRSPYHYRGDVRQVLYSREWDLLVAHPPCTHLAVSGALHFKKKRSLQEEALDFFLLLLNAPIPQICVENPISVVSTRILRPTQIIQPFWFGDPERKTTCLWLKNLWPLKPTKLVKPNLHTYKDGRTVPNWHSKLMHAPKIVKQRERSRTYPGLAKAMAEQWGTNLDKNLYENPYLRIPRGLTKKSA